MEFSSTCYPPVKGEKGPLDRTNGPSAGRAGAASSDEQTLRGEAMGEVIGKVAIVIADAVVRLCSDRSTFVTGQAIAVDGGYVAR